MSRDVTQKIKTGYVSQAHKPHILQPKLLIHTHTNNQQSPKEQSWTNLNADKK